MTPAEGFPLTAELTQHPGIRAAIVAGGERVAQGEAFPEAAAALRCFDRAHVRLLYAGERTGRTMDVLRRLAVIYRERFHAGVERLIAMIEPALIVLFSAAIGGLLAAVMLPLIGVMFTLL